MPRILLVEPDYKNKYPPIALMKLATYHRNRGDIVEFYKGEAPYTKIIQADRIYITSMFTFQYEITVKTIKHYLRYKHVDNVYIGGIAVTLLTERFIAETGVTKVLTGLLTDSSVLGYNDHINIDELPLDYDILDDVSYQYPAADNYFIHTTRGCPRGCEFCAVRILEPKFETTNHIIDQIRCIDEKYGPKRNLMIMDNNILCSPHLEQIVNDIISLGFDGSPNFIRPNVFSSLMRKIERRVNMQVDYYHLIEKAISEIRNFSKRIARYLNVINEYTVHVNEILEAEDKLAALRNHQHYFTAMFEKYSSKTKLTRYVDCNQGIDARLISEKTIKHLSKIPIRPFRLAFDDINDSEIFLKATQTAIDYGITHFSNYMLYNWKDRPQDLWKRLDLATKIYNSQANKVTGFSFPMKYAPIDETDRSFVGMHWKKKQLRAINVIINVTKGVVAKERDFFEEAFGSNEDEFLEILAMPDELIRFRHFFRDNGILNRWSLAYRSLTKAQKEELMNIISEIPNNPEITNRILSEEIASILPYYFLKRKAIEQNPTIVDSFIKWTSISSNS